MTCIKNCKTDDVQFVFSGASGTYVITAWADETAFISFDEDQTTINIKRDSVGNVYSAGHNYVIRPFSLTVDCSDEARILDAAWRANPMDFCGDAEIISGCCEDYSFESIRLTGVTAPAIGTEVGTFTFSFEGVVK